MHCHNYPRFLNSGISTSSHCWCFSLSNASGNCSSERNETYSRPVLKISYLACPIKTLADEHITSVTSRGQRKELVFSISFFRFDLLFSLWKRPSHSHISNVSAIVNLCIQSAFLWIHMKVSQRGRLRYYSNVYELAICVTPKIILFLT